MSANREDPEEGQRAFIPKKNPRNYKPLAIKIPTLLLFISVLAVCVGLIESLVRNVGEPSVVISESRQTTTITKGVQARATSFVPADVPCSDFPRYKAIYTNLATSVLNLCPTFSKSYAGGSSLSPAKQTAFQQFIGSFSKLQNGRDDALTSWAHAADDCKSRGVTTVPEWMSTRQWGEYVAYVGCTSTTISTPCIPATAYTYLQSGTISSSTYSQICGVSVQSMLTQISGQPVTVVGFTTGLPLPTPGVAYFSATATVTVFATGEADFEPGPSVSHTANWITTITMYIVGDVDDVASTALAGPIETNKIKALTTPEAASSTDLLQPTETSTKAIVKPTASSTQQSLNQSISPSAISLVIESDTVSLKSSVIPPSSNPATSSITVLGASSTITPDANSGLVLNTNTITDTASSSTEPVLVLVPSQTALTSTAETGASSTVRPSSSSTKTNAISSSTRTATSPKVESAANPTKSSVTTSPTLPVPQGVHTVTSTIVTTDSEGHTTSVRVKFLTSDSSSLIATITTPASISSVALMYSTMTTSTSTTAAPPTFGQVIDAKLAQYEKVVDGHYDPMGSYFAAVYLPALLAVIFKIIWEIIDASFRMMEPFYRLSNPKGIPAKQSLFAQYLSSSLSFEPLKACLEGYYVPMLTITIYCLVTILVSVTPSSMTIRSTDTCEVSPGVSQPCAPQWFINMVIIRVVEALLLTCLVLALCIIPLTYRSKSGISANPSSIASVANLVNHDELVQAFRRVDPQATKKQLINALQGNQCRLEHRESANKGYNYGIGRVYAGSLPNSQLPSRSPSQSNSTRPGGYSAVHNPAMTSNHESRFEKFLSRKLRLMVYDIVQLVSTVALFIMVTFNRFNFDDNAFNRFFNNGNFTGSFAFVAIASIVDMQWKRLEREVRITEPYRRMAQGFQQPETTVLMELNGTCWSSLYNSARKMFQFRHMWFQTLVSFTAVLSDFNIIAAANVVFNPAQTWTAFIVAGAISMTITALMMVVMLLTMIWWRRGVVRSLPRSPSTIGAVFSYLCASRFARQMEHLQLEYSSQEERDQLVTSTGWRFSFGWKVGLDGQCRWMVDYESTEASRALEEETILAK